QETAHAEEKLALLAGAREQLGDQFRVLAEEVMARHGDGFAKQNKEQIDHILEPLRERLGQFERAVQHSQTESTRERATLGEQIRQVADVGAAMQQRTKDLTEALRGRAQMQGAWGEMVLATILEKCGLRLGEEYSTQRSFTGEEGNRLRPDVLIHLPGRQDLVVDSKVSLVAFAELCREEADEQTRTLARRRHVDSVRAHVAALGEKNYQTLGGSALDYVLMFVPIEGALAAAIAADPTLVNFALEKRVTLVTPTTLMVALRTVHSVWQVERRHRNADDIADRAGKLYDKFAGFVTDLGAVRDSLDKSRAALDGAMNKLSAGRGNLLNQAEKLRQMGARTTKTLPAAMLAQIEEADPVEGALSEGG
ncbi:MAG: DNA recombination protein RmuC, partial [Gluconacetobacter diazotrophicus]|nr:DNA recombination protein RmuC [Gluconacetobacter diazotrophicus]